MTKNYLKREGIRSMVLRKYNTLFEMKNPYLGSFKNSSTEASFKAKWDYSQKMRSKIILCNDIDILLEIQKFLNDLQK